MGLILAMERIWGDLYNRWNEFDMGLILAMERMEISTAGNVFDMEQSLLPAAGKLLSSCQVFKKNPLL